MTKPESENRFDLSRFLFASFTGFLGGHLTNYSVILFSQDVWNSDAFAGIGFGLCFGTPLILGWFGGAWCDSHSPQKIAQIAHSFFLISILFLNLTIIMPEDWNKIIFLTGALFAGIGWSILAPARMALLGRLAGNKQAKFAVIFNILVMLGFGLAPPLLSLCKKIDGWNTVHYFGAGLFVLSILSLIGLKTPGFGRESSAIDRIQKGIGYVKASPILKEAILFAIIVYLSMGPVQVMLPRFATNILSLSEISRGLFLGAIALALLLGGGVSLGLAKKFGFGKMIALSGLTSGVSICLLGVSTSIEVSLVLLLFSGMGAGISISLIVALLQTESKPEFRGRLLSLYTITSQVVPAFSGLMSGFILTVFTVDKAVIGVGAFLAFFLFVGILRLKTLRTYKPAA
ncbi:MAG: MFS transporter [Leptospiraceae bacterium]|nr:MFS transporter [Leptospiraceae bacterium]MCK6381311.1 MFS transporter [Leptospiraceae bacterium]NUM40790.1 MFS transporter [Leptospiraceae bacterium]